MAAALKAAIEAAFGASYTATVAFDPATYRCTLSVAGAGSVALDCRGATKPTNWGLAYYLGFPANVVTSATTPGASPTTSLTGTAIATMDPENYYLIDIDELNAVSETAMYADGGTRGAFAKVPLNQKAYGQVSIYDKTLVCNELRPPRARLDRLSISVRFHDGTPVDLNGGEFSLTIELTCTQTRGT